MSVIRRINRPADAYTMISNEFVRDDRLSLKARGLGAWLMSHADGWETSVAAVARAVGAGREQVRSALAELEEHGYLRREQTRAEDGTLGHALYLVQCTPFPDEPAGENRERETGITVSRSRVPGPHKKTNSKKTNEKTNSPPGGDDASAAAPDPDQGIPDPHTPQAVVAAYVDSFRDSHGGADPVRSVIAQVGREAKRLLTQYPPALVLAAAADLGKTVYRSLERQVMMATEAQGGARPAAQAGRAAMDRDQYWAEQQAAHPERFSQPMDERELRQWLDANGGKAF